MPDDNKHETLREMGFVVRDTCESCVHWKPPARGHRTRWGFCTTNTYSHGKHTGGPRPVGTPRNGWCAGFERRPDEELRPDYDRYWERVDRGQNS